MANDDRYRYGYDQSGGSNRYPQGQNPSGYGSAYGQDEYGYGRGYGQPNTRQQTPAAQNQAPYGYGQPYPADTYGQYSQQQPANNNWAQEYSQRAAHSHAAPAGNTPNSALAITSIILGGIALLTSFIPFVNNISFFLALIGLVLGIIGLVQCIRGTRSGKVLAIVGVVVCVVAGIIVLVTQSMYSRALDDAVRNVSNGPSVVSSDGADNMNLALGQTVRLANGMAITVNSVDTSYTNYDGSPLLAVSVSYVNEGTQSASFNPFDWKSQDASGVQSTYTLFAGEGPAALSSGSLAPGGRVDGTLYFAAGIQKVLYFGSIAASNPSAAWNIG